MGREVGEVGEAKQTSSALKLRINFECLTFWGPVTTHDPRQPGGQLLLAHELTGHGSRLPHATCLLPEISENAAQKKLMKSVNKTPPHLPPAGRVIATLRSCSIVIAHNTCNTHNSSGD